MAWVLPQIVSRVIGCFLIRIEASVPDMSQLGSVLMDLSEAVGGLSPVPSVCPEMMIIFFRRKINVLNFFQDRGGRKKLPQAYI
jgi:hypothetical protein